MRGAVRVIIIAYAWQFDDYKYGIYEFYMKFLLINSWIFTTLVLLWFFKKPVSELIKFIWPYITWYNLLFILIILELLIYVEFLPYSNFNLYLFFFIKNLLEDKFFIFLVMWFIFDQRILFKLNNTKFKTLNALIIKYCKIKKFIFNFMKKREPAYFFFVWVWYLKLFPHFNTLLMCYIFLM